MVMALALPLVACSIAPPSTTGALGQLHHSLRVGPSKGASDVKWWLGVATLARDSAEELAAEADDADAAAAQSKLHVAQQLCGNLLEQLREERDEGELAQSASILAVAKLSRKRNGDLSDRRACERCLAELALLLGSLRVLEPPEQAALLDDVRPLAQTVTTAQRLPALLVVCRGFHSPGFGSAHNWRRGSATVHQRLAGWADVAPRAAASSIEPLLRAEPRAAAHSVRLRAAHALLHTPLQVWLASLAPEARPAAAMRGEASAASLLVRLAARGGDDGARAAGTLGQWAIDQL
eukprot:4460468-Prymnesium_polylepis.1